MIQFDPIQGSDYRIRLYPTDVLFKKYLTNQPRNLCIIAVIMISFTGILVLLHSHCLKNREKRLTEVAKHAFASNASRDAVLLAKKMYVRYISHEMRTPLNSTFMGLKLLELVLSKAINIPNYEDCCDTLKDVCKSCDLVLDILNDLLNYDKLEDGDLALDVKKITILPFIIDSVNTLILQGREKNVRLLIDADEKFETDPYRNRWKNNELVATSMEMISMNVSRCVSENKMTANDDQFIEKDQMLPHYDTSISISKEIEMIDVEHTQDNTTSIKVEETEEEKEKEIRERKGNENGNGEDFLISEYKEQANIRKNYLLFDDCLEGDEQKLNQVIRNVISNAIKFAPSGKNVTVRIRYSKNIINKMDYYNLLHYTMIRYKFNFVVLHLPFLSPAV